MKTTTPVVTNTKSPERSRGCGASETSMPTCEIGWWGSRAIAPGRGLAYQIGALRLGVLRLDDEWQISYERSDHQETDDLEWSCEPAGAECVDFGARERVFLGDCGGELLLLPALPDRSVVSRPLSSFVVEANRSLTAYVSAPVWARLFCANTGTQLAELSIIRPSDTWFGANTRSGELCYGGNTQMRHKLGDLPPRLHRVVVPVNIENQAATPLRIERVLLPMPYLSLYVRESEGSLWTQPVRMVREEDGQMGRMVYDDLPPGLAGDFRRLADPRLSGDSALFQRALSALFV